MGLEAALWAEHHPLTPQPSFSRSLQTLPSWNQAPHAEESLSSQGKVTSQSPKCSFLVLLHPRTQPCEASNPTQSLHVLAAGTAPHICTAGSLTKYLIITFSLFFFFLIINFMWPGARMKINTALPAFFLPTAPRLRPHLRFGSESAHCKWGYANRLHIFLCA